MICKEHGTEVVAVWPDGSPAICQKYLGEPDFDDSQNVKPEARLAFWEHPPRG